jgi:hypothetical protein
MPIQSGPVPKRRQHILCIEWNGHGVKVARVQYHKEQLFLHLAYHPACSGALFNGEMEAGVITKTFDHTEIGWATTYHVKYSHPVEGDCHFSQTGKIYTRVRTPGACLDTGGGHIFTLLVEGLEHFTPVIPKDAAEAVTVCSFPQNRPPRHLHLIGRWLQPDDLRPGVPVQNPLGTIDDYGNRGHGIAVAPPDDSPFRGRLLLVQPSERPVDFSGSQSPFHATFLAGFTKVPHSQAQRFIGLQYPAINTADMPNIDYPGPTT